MRMTVFLSLFTSYFLSSNVGTASPLKLKFLPHHHHDLTKVLMEVRSYKEVANRIIDFTMNGVGKHQTYNRLAEFVDKFGSRLAGTQNLENAIDYMLDTMTKAGLENVHGEEVTVPRWLRGNESATLLKPRLHPMAILGLGSSVGTPPEGITAEAIVVRTFDELQNRSAEVKGKIVVYNQIYVSYGVSVEYRSVGAAQAAKFGAVASLIRSVTPFSINSPHTGHQNYEKGVPQIPTACLTVEDAEMLDRMAARGEKIVIQLNMDAQNFPSTISRNTVAEIRGRELPDQVVLVSGHLDSWDVGQGAMDDGGGAFISWQALSIVQQLGLRPRRTLRAVLWTAEEEGLVGSQQYWLRHKGDIANYDLVMESDIGTFQPQGLGFTGNAQAQTVMAEVMQLLAPINATYLRSGADGGDVGYWISAGVPGGSLVNSNDKYFDFHHSNGDTMTVQDPDQMDACAALWAVVAFTVADLQDMLPRNATLAGQ